MGWLYVGHARRRLADHGHWESPSAFIACSRIARSTPIAGSSCYWMALGALSVEGSPLVWCAVHRRHHELSDQPGDPHSPHLHGDGLWNTLRGLWYRPDRLALHRLLDSPDLQRYVPDLLADQALVAVDRLYYLWVIVSLAVPTAIGGLVTWSWQGALLGLVWGGLVRIFITHHITWSINSICHVFGRQDYDAHDDSRNNWLCGLLGLGEGWHNNHHAFPTSARHGLAWWQFDVSWLIIRGMELSAWPGTSACRVKRRWRRSGGREDSPAVGNALRGVPRTALDHDRHRNGTRPLPTERFRDHHPPQVRAAADDELPPPHRTSQRSPGSG